MSNPIRRTNRHAFSTVELLVSLSIASVLTLGLSGAILVSSQSLDLPEPPSHSQLLVDNSFGQIRDRVADAKHIQVDRERITLISSGENGDVQSTYALDGDEILESIGTSPKRSIMKGVEGIDISSTTATPLIQEQPQVSCEGIRTTSVGGKRAITVPYPAGSVVGHLLLLVLAYDSDSGSVPTADPGWTFVRLTKGEDESIAIWYKPIESLREKEVTATWQGGNDAMACLLQLRNVDMQNPVLAINESADEFEGPGQGPAAPPLSASETGSLIVQALITNKNVLENQVGGLSAHVTCCYEERSNLAMVCSVRQVGNAVGIVDADNRYRFSGSAEYVMTSLALRAN